MWWPALAAGLAGLAPFGRRADRAGGRTGQPELLNINVT